MKKINIILLLVSLMMITPTSCKKEEVDDSEGTTGTFTDTRDDHTYKWVKIGEQIWMAENLAYTGDDIQHITDNSEWENNYFNENTDLNYNAWCYYDNNAENGNIYGVLYQWEAAKKACPECWHLPSIEEWEQLENYLTENGYSYDGIIGNNYVAKSLASSTGWNNSEVQGAVGNSDYQKYRNKTGFSALPGGFRFFSDGSFMSIGLYSSWWSANDGDFNLAYHQILHYESSTMQWFWEYKTEGLSVRCIKD